VRAGGDERSGMDLAGTMAEQRWARRQELARFLRQRRARVDPEQWGIPVRKRRRAPGLRREEVADLAGVSTTWYTWLEQGRDINASEQVLIAVGRALLLDHHEQAHLFTLAGREQPQDSAQRIELPAAVEAVMRQLDPLPAAVYNARSDILAFNEGYRWLMGMDLYPEADRNVMVLRFTNAHWQARVDPEMDTIAVIVANFRAAYAQHVGEPAWKELIRRLQGIPLFDELWARHDVEPRGRLVKRYKHPEAGLVTFDSVPLWISPQSDIRLSVNSPADERSRAALEQVPLRGPQYRSTAKWPAT
jgi:transcriptional regulator with XRE-family HTH domain